MRRVATAFAAAAMVALGALVATGGPASAQASCTGPQTASQAAVFPSSLLPGESLTLTGGGFGGNQVLGIGLFRPPVVLASVASDVYGNFTATIQLPLATPPGQNEITVFGRGPDLANGTATCHQSLALFTVRELYVPPPVVNVYTPPVYSPPIYSPPVTYVVAATPAPIVVQQPLARTGAATPALVAAGLLAMLLGFHAVRITGRRESIAG